MDLKKIERMLTYCGKKDAEEAIRRIQQELIFLLHKEIYTINENNEKIISCIQKITYGGSNNIPYDYRGYCYLRCKEVSSIKNISNDIFKSYQEKKQVKTYYFTIESSGDIRTDTYFKTLFYLARKERIAIDLYVKNNETNEEYNLPTTLSVEKSVNEKKEVCLTNFDSISFDLYVKATFVILEKDYVENENAHINISIEQKINMLYSKVTKIDDFALNIINMVGENTFLQRDIVILLQRIWGFCKYRNMKVQYEFPDIISEINLYLKNMAQIIVEDYCINKMYAEKLSWMAIKRNSIIKYSEQWRKEYEIYLPYTLKESISLKNYIMEIVKCNEIDCKDETTVALLSYYVIDMCHKDVFFPEVYDKVNTILLDIKQEVTNERIKNRIKNSEKIKKRYSINDIDMMTGLEFEKFVCFMFQRMGYRAEVTKQTRDQGIDVIAEKRDIKIGIQTKCYTNTVGNIAIQEAVAGRRYYNCKKVIVITNNRFTSAAIDLAKCNDVILWDRDMLKEKIKEI